MSGERFDGITLIVERLTAIDNKIDGLKDDATTIKISVATHAEILKGQHAQLAEHIRRTHLLEEKLEPVENHVSMISGALKLVTVTATVIGIIAAIIGIIKAFF